MAAASLLFLLVGVLPAQDLGRAPQKLDPTWVLRFSMGPTRTDYANTDLRLKTSTLDFTARNIKIRERHSMDYYDPTHGDNPFQVIDEPSNTFVLSAENVKRGYAVNLMVQHPKFLVAEDGLNTHVPVNGTVEGTAVGAADLDELFDGNYKMTANHYTIMMGAEKILTLTKGRFGALDYRPGFYAGVHLGRSDIDYQGQKTIAPYGVIGGGVQLTNRLVYHLPQDRVTASLSHHLGASHLSYPALDGTASQELNYQGVALTVGYRLTAAKKRR